MRSPSNLWVHPRPLWNNSELQKATLSGARAVSSRNADAKHVHDRRYKVLVGTVFSDTVLLLRWMKFWKLSPAVPTSEFQLGHKHINAALSEERATWDEKAKLPVNRSHSMRTHWKRRLSSIHIGTGTKKWTMRGWNQSEPPGHWITRGRSGSVCQDDRWQRWQSFPVTTAENQNVSTCHLRNWIPSKRKTNCGR